MQIRLYRPADEADVVALWQDCGLTRPWNDPYRDIARKLAEQPELFFVGELGGRLIASIMVGYEGHRGVVNYLAVHGDHQGSGYGRVLMAHAEQVLLARGCPKLNVLVRTGNEPVLAFYAKLGYQVDAAVSLGKRLIPDN